MTQSPQSGNEQEHSNRRFWLLLLGRTSIALGVILLIGVAGGAWWARNFINKDLAPLVERNIKQLLGRPVELGKVERFSLNSLRFGSLSIPATSTDPDRVAAKAVFVEFSPLQLLLNRTLQLNITLVQPDVYIEQDKDNRWVSAQIKTGEGTGFIQTELQTIRLQDADVELAPTPRPGRPKGSVALDQVSGIARLLDQNQRISYELSGQPTRGGKVKIAGETRLTAEQTNLSLQTENLQASDITRLVELPAIALLSGSVDANLAVQLQPNQSQTSATGTVNLNQLTAQINNIPQKITNTQGRLIFQGQQVVVENLSTGLGKIPVQVNGTINAQTGYNAKVQVKAVNVKNILDTLNVKSPVAAAGEVRADIQVQGPIQQPILTGSVSTIKAAQVDRVQFNAISSRFQVKTSGAESEIALSNIQLIPTVGGQITGSGQIQLGRQSRVMLDIQAQGVPANALAQTYGFSTPINIGNVSANAKISGALGNQPLDLALNNIRANPTLGGEITGSGQIQLASQGRVLLNVQAQGVPANALAQAYGFSPPINIGNVSANAKISGTLGNQPLEVTVDSIRANPEIGGQIAASGQIQLASQGRVLLNVQAQGVPANALAQAYGFSPPINIGNVSANAKISGAIGNQPLQVTVDSIRANPEVGGQIAASGQIQLAPQGRVLFNVQAENVPGDALAKAYNVSPPITIGNVSANARISGSLDNLRTVAQLQAPAATYPGTGQVVITNNGGNIQFQDAVLKVAGGTVRGRGQLAQGRWQAFVDAQQIQLSRFAQIPPQFQGLLSTELNLSGTTAEFQPKAIQARGQARLNVASGTVNLRNISLNAGRWQAIANLSQIQLNRFSNQLQGRLSSDLLVAGITDSLQLSDIRAAGQVRFSQLALLEQPLTAQVQWNGKQIIVQRATTPGLSANGAIALQVEGTAPQITGFNLNVAAVDYNLQNSPVTLPNNVALAGRIDFTGQITGTPSAPNAVGDLRLRNLAVNGLAFDPLLAGQVNFQSGLGAQLELAGSRQDRIALTLGPNNRPSSFLVRRDSSVATGRAEGDNLLVNVQSFPVAILKSLIPGNTLNLEPLAGEISGNLVANLAETTAVGDVAIAQPRIGRITANEFRGRLSYANGAATLTNGELLLGESRISLSGNVQTGNNPQFQAQVNFDQARIDNILQAFNVFSFQDISTGLQSPQLAGAEALQTVPVSLPSTDLLTQLQQFSKIAAQVAQQRTQRQDAQTLPTLAELQGAISGGIAVGGSLQSGLNANFNILGSNWKWGDYIVNEVIAKGTFENGILTLQPLRVDLSEGLLAFSGQLGNEQLSGQLQAQSLPIALLQPFLEELPVDFQGQLNANATLGGSLKDPTVLGELALVNGILNQQPVQRAQVGFSYNDARFNFESTVLVTGTQPVQITGSIPAKLPFASVQPDSNQISINAAVQDEGLALLNVFTNQVTWVEGQGQLNVEVRGTLNKPTITGKATVNNATLRAEALTEPLTNVTGALQFNRDRLTVEGVQGQYSQGELTALGVIPIFTAQPTVTNPLTVSLNNLDMNLPGLYQGRVSGDVVIGGAALDPTIGGVISLSNGQVSLAQSGNTRSQAAGTGAVSARDSVTTRESVNTRLQAAPGSDNVTSGSTGESTNAASAAPEAESATTVRPPIGLANLRLILDNNVRVVRRPLLSFGARGELTINGTLANPRPEGVINLTSGQVNLFTSQFTLLRGYEQTARFTPSRGLDPTLDVRLVAIVSESSGSSQNRTLASPFSSEVEDVPITSSFGTLRTVRVQARATGPASELDQNLELTSEPRRSEGEIVALLGGSIINSLGQGDATVGIATIASSTLLGGLQGRISSIGQAIGFSEFRLFPTTISPNREERSSVLGLAAEGVFDIGNDISVSLSRVFATDEPFRYNVLYRLNDEILVRGATNLADESQVLFEYETRF